MARRPTPPRLQKEMTPTPPTPPTPPAPPSPSAPSNPNPESQPQASAGNGAASVQPPVFRVENMLVKNISLEIPDRIEAPAFRGEPAIRMEMRNRARALARPNCHEVVLEVTARVNDGEETQLLVEVSQAGVFFIQGETAEQREILLNVHAPETLYPYVAQMLADLAARAGSPRFFPPPFNFRALYDQKRRAVAKREREAAE